MSTVLIFDVDQTLGDEGELYEGVAELLTELATRGYLLYVCSLNPFAEHFLSRQGVRDLFQGVIDVPWELSKAQTILNFIANQLVQVHFFDDDPETIQEALLAGIPSTLVPIGGVTKEVIELGLNRG